MGWEGGTITETSAAEAEGGRGVRQSADREIFAPSSITHQFKKTLN